MPSYFFSRFLIKDIPEHLTHLAMWRDERAWHITFVHEAFSMGINRDTIAKTMNFK